MNEQDLFQQYEQTGNLMDLFQNHAWVREMARIEEESECDISAGMEWGVYLGAAFANPDAAESLVKLHSMLTQWLQDLLSEWNLGIASSVALERGKQLLMGRFKNTNQTIQEQLVALLESSNTANQENELKVIVQSLLSQEDWEQIAQAASHGVHQYILQKGLAQV